MDPVVELGSAMSRFAELSAAAFGTEPVPTCPGWTVDDLVTHLGSVHRWAGAIVLSGQRVEEPHTMHVSEPISEWYSGIAAALLEILRAVDPDEPTPNFARLNEVAAFWPRRQLHETTIHAIDVGLALGLGEDAWPVPTAVAADGVDEVLGVFAARMTARGQRPHLKGRVRLTATDTGRTWVLGEADDQWRTPIRLFAGPDVETDGHITGTAQDLYLTLWGRASRDRVSADSAAASELLDGPLVP